MAAPRRKPAAAAARDPEAVYAVTLTAPVPFGRTWLRPGAGLKLKGKVVDALPAEAVEAAVPFVAAAPEA